MDGKEEKGVIEKLTLESNQHFEQWSNLVIWKDWIMGLVGLVGSYHVSATFLLHSMLEDPAWTSVLYSKILFICVFKLLVKKLKKYKKNYEKNIILHILIFFLLIF